jgi:hypothetical protein
MRLRLIIRSLFGVWHWIAIRGEHVDVIGPVRDFSVDAIATAFFEYNFPVELARWRQAQRLLEAA